MERPRPWDGFGDRRTLQHSATAISAVCVRAVQLSKLPLIAVVDDDPAMREALVELLQVVGLAGRSYASAADFLDDYAPGDFNLVITDLRMPKIDGVELLRRLGAVGAAPPAIVVTSSACPATRARAMELGAVACLTKPLADEALLTLIAATLDPDRKGSILEP